MMDLVADAVVTSTAGGVINGVYGDWPTASPDWAALITVYAEYRVLAGSLQFTPNVEGATIAALAYGVLYMVWDAQDTAGALASYTAAANYPVKSVRSLNCRNFISHKMTGNTEATYALTSSAVLDYTFKLYADTLTASTNYGRVTQTWKVEFRGRV